MKGNTRLLVCKQIITCLNAAKLDWEKLEVLAAQLITGIWLRQAGGGQTSTIQRNCGKRFWHLSRSHLRNRIKVSRIKTLSTADAQRAMPGFVIRFNFYVSGGM